MERLGDQATMVDVAQFHFALNNVRVRLGLVDKTRRALAEDNSP